jgi:thiamine biosynthesis lipoprotein
MLNRMLLSRIRGSAAAQTIIRSKALLAALAVLAFIAGSGPSRPVHANGKPRLERLQETRFLMGTQVDVIVLAESRARGLRGLQACFEAMERVESLMSDYDPDSPLSLLNRTAHERWVTPPEEVFGLIRRSLEIGRASDGAFDITVKPLLDIWRKARAESKPPDPSQVRAALDRVGYSLVELDVAGKRVHFQKPGMAVDLGGIAKGYALDKAAEALLAAKIDHALINAGGDVLTVGGKGEKGWLIGIKDPRERNALLATLRVRGVAVVTSGDYERFFMYKGTRYHHILDPRTGYPAVGCRSVSVVGRQAALADALATAAFVMGPEKGLAFLEGWPGMEGLVVDDRGGKRVTSGLAGELVWH